MYLGREMYMSETKEITEVLSAEEFREIKERLTKAYNLVSSHQMSKLPKQINEDIAKVARCYQRDVRKNKDGEKETSGDSGTAGGEETSGKDSPNPEKEKRKLTQDEKNLLNLACLVATDSAWHYYQKEAANYLDSYRTEMSDLYQEFYLLVQEELPSYQPEYDLLTFLKTRVKPAFSATKTKGAGIYTTKHYQDAGVKIRHAERELAKIGNDNPSAEDIYEYIAGTQKKEVAITTIMRYRAQNPAVLPIDLSKIAVLGGERIKGPEEELIREEELKTFYETKGKLPSTLLNIMNMQLKYIEMYGKVPDAQELCEKAAEKGYHYTAERISNLIRAAYLQLRRYYQWRDKRAETPVNNIKFNAQELAAETEDVIAALDEDEVDFFEE